jgi:hypothetical protein
MSHSMSCHQCWTEASGVSRTTIRECPAMDPPRYRADRAIALPDPWCGVGASLAESDPIGIAYSRTHVTYTARPD